MAAGADGWDVQLYLREIHQSRLLSAEEEKSLARRMIEQKDALARDQLILCNLRLVVSVARRYCGRGLPLSDLIAEGNVGLLKAVDRFDPEFGGRFSTYAMWWIKQTIRRALINSVPMVHVPAYMNAMVGTFRAAMRKLEQEFGRPATIEELAAHLAMPLGKVRRMRAAMSVLHARSQRGSGEGDLTIEELLADDNAPGPGESAETKDEVGKMRTLVELIDHRTTEILAMRYGLAGRGVVGLREIGQRLGVTHERVRQIEERALARLRRRMVGCG